MSSHSGTIGRTKGISLTSQMRRQRSVEWHHERSGYSSSEDDDRHGAINPSFDTQLLAQLIAQSQELSNKCKWNSLPRYLLKHVQVMVMIVEFYIRMKFIRGSGKIENRCPIFL